MTKDNIYVYALPNENKKLKPLFDIRQIWFNYIQVLLKALPGTEWWNHEVYGLYGVLNGYVTNLKFDWFV